MKLLRKSNLRFAPLLLLCLFAASSCSSITKTSVPKYPSNDGYVTDTADIISPQLEDELETLITNLETKTTAQVAVVTVPSTKPESIEQYAVRLYEKWGIGEKSKDNGVLLLIAPGNESPRIRIEVGYGLEGAINDAWCGRVIRDVMAPHCEAGDMDRCVASGAIAIIGKAAGEYKYKLNESAQLVPADGAAPPPDAQAGAPAGEPFRDISGEAQKSIPTTPAGIVKKLMSNIVGVIVVIFMIILFITNPRLFFLLLFMRGGGGGWSSGDRGGFGGGFGGFGGGSSGGGGASGW